MISHLVHAGGVVSCRVLELKHAKDETEGFLIRQSKTGGKFSRESFSSSHENDKNKQITYLLTVGFFQLPWVGGYKLEVLVNSPDYEMATVRRLSRF